MSTTASGREVYAIGRETDGTREVVIQENATVHDLPAGAKVTYASEQSRFPYVV